MSTHGPESMVRRLLDISRYQTVFTYFKYELLNFGEWSLTFKTAMPFLLLFYLLLLGVSVKKQDLAAANIAVLLTVFMMVGYFFVYILSPFDLKWHLDTSLDRLLLQVWPLAIYTYFAIVRAPGQAVMKPIRTKPEPKSYGMLELSKAERTS